jgi:hypothetical protein
MNVKWLSNNCRHQEEAISLLVSQLLPDDKKAPLEAHLKTCGGCRQYFQELSELKERVSSLKSSVSKRAPSENLYAQWSEQILGGPRELKKEVTPWRQPTYRIGLIWGTALAVCLAIVLATPHWHGERRHTSAENILQNTTFIRETLAMFPNRVRAIVQDEHGLNVILSDQGEIPPSTPFYVHVCDGSHCASYVTFSGQEIQVDGQHISVLADRQGKMILVGENFLWSDKDRIYPDNRWKVEAKNLGSADAKG